MNRNSWRRAVTAQTGWVAVENFRWPSARAVAKPASTRVEDPHSELDCGSTGTERASGDSGGHQRRGWRAHGSDGGGPTHDIRRAGWGKTARTVRGGAAVGKRN